MVAWTNACRILATHDQPLEDDLKTTAKFVGVVALSAVLAGCSGAAKPPAAKPAVKTAENQSAQNAPAALDSPISREAPAPLDSPVGRGLAGDIAIVDAVIESVVLKASDTATPKLTAELKGVLGDSCTSLGDVTQKRDGKLIRVSVKTQRPKDKMCAQVISELKTTIDIDTQGLDAGDHQVVVNGIIAPFKIAANGTFEISK